MKMHCLIFFFLICFPAAAGINITFPVSSVKQGSFQDVRINLDEETAQKFELQKIKGKTIGDILYIHSVSPLLRKNGNFEADAVVIFAKVPESDSTIFRDGANEVTVTWNSVTVLPTEVPKELMFLDFEIPEPVRLAYLIVSLVIVVFAAFFGRKFYKRQKIKNENKRKLKALKDQLISTASYENVVEIWKCKQLFLKEFPALEKPFKELEATLFKYQFKPSQSGEEKEEVLKAWKTFIESSKGGFDGI